MNKVIDVRALVIQCQVMDPLPNSTLHLSRLISLPDADLDEIVETIAFDQALTGKLLGYANSAASGSRQPIHTVASAVVRMGLGSVLSFSVGCHFRGSMDQAVPAYGLDEGELWRHSAAASVSAESIARVLGDVVRPESVTSALLHDLGKLALGRHAEPGVLQPLRQALAEATGSKTDVERQLLGLHHGELGGLIAEHWGLPASIVEGIAYHHAPQLGTLGVADAVHAANEIAKRLEASDPDLPLLLESIDPDVRQRLRLDAAALRKVLDLAAVRLDEVLATYA